MNSYAMNKCKNKACRHYVWYKEDRCVHGFAKNNECNQSSKRTKKPIILKSIVKQLTPLGHGLGRRDD